MNWKQTLLLGVAMALVAGCAKKEDAPPKPTQGAPVATADAPPVKLHIDGVPGASAAEVPAEARASAQTCSACHQAIVEEWSRSMHAASTAEANRLYDLMFQKARNVDVSYENGCRRCHYPAWWREAMAANLPVEGVSCVVCHRISPDHPKALADGAVAVWAQTQEGRNDSLGLCLSCHDTLSNKEGQPVCTTGPEATAAGISSCTECHMPDVDGPSTAGVEAEFHASHTFPGGHWPEFVQQSASIAVERDGDALVVTVAPVDAGHAIPTGSPMRYMAAHVEAFDAAGAMVWQNYADEGPPLEHPQALFMRVFADGEGNRPVPPFIAKGPGEDLRLEPNGKRVLRYPIPANAVQVTATLEYGLAPPKLLAAANVPAEWRQPVVVSQAGLDLTQPPTPANVPAEGVE